VWSYDVVTAERDSSQGARDVSDVSELAPSTSEVGLRSRSDYYHTTMLCLR